MFNFLKYYIYLFNYLESSSIFDTIKRKKNIELMNESNDIDRAFNPFQKKTDGQPNISIGTLSPLDQVILLSRIIY